jgi:hypothetical protein
MAGWDIFKFAWVIQMLLFAGTIFFSGLLFLKEKYPPALFFLGLCFLCFSIPFYNVSLWMWSEQLFLFLLVVFFYLFNKFIDHPCYKYLIPSAIVCSLAWLTRYTGVVIAMTGLIFILKHKGLVYSLRIKMALIFTAIASSPSGAWLLRNYFLTHTLTGLRAPSNFHWFQNLFISGNVIAGWFLPSFITDFLGIIIFLAFLSLLFYMGRNNDRVKFSIVFVVLYCLFLVLTASKVYLDRIDNRLLSPVYLPLIYMMLQGVNNLITDQRRFRQVFSMLSISLFLVYPACFVLSSTINLHAKGGRFTIDNWSNLPVVKWLQSHSLKGLLYSNAPHVIYLGTGLNAKRVPDRLKGWSEMMKRVKNGEDVYLIWFGNQLSGLCELSTKFKLKLLKEFPWTVVFKVEGKN